MPIGFWAVSREELRFWAAAHLGYTPDRKTLDLLVKTLPKQLDQAVENHLDYYAERIYHNQDK
jgi:hypothetical protein